MHEPDSGRRDLVDFNEGEDPTAETTLITVDGFLDVSLEFVEATGWINIASARWRFKDENSIVIESRPLTRC